MAVRVTLPAATWARVSRASRRACSTEPERISTPRRRPRYLVPSMAASVQPRPVLGYLINDLTLRGWADRLGQYRANRDCQRQHRKKHGQKQFAHQRTSPSVMRGVSSDLTALSTQTNSNLV